jgi:hypothetical protein
LRFEDAIVERAEKNPYQEQGGIIVQGAEDYEVGAIWGLGMKTLLDYTKERKPMVEQRKEKNKKDWKELNTEIKNLEKLLCNVKKKSFTKRNGANTNLGRWEVTGPARILRTLWRALQVSFKDLQIGLTPVYLNLKYSPDRHRAERNEINGLEEVPKKRCLRIGV